MVFGSGNVFPAGHEKENPLNGKPEVSRSRLPAESHAEDAASPIVKAVISHPLGRCGLMESVS